MKRLYLLALVLILTPAAVSAESAKPKRIVSLAVVTDEVVLSIVGRDRIAAVSPYASDARTSHVAELASGIPSLRRDDVDGILARDPDLVLLSTRAPREVERLLGRAGVAVLRVPTPESLGDIRDHVQRIGEAVGEPGRAAALLREMEHRISRLERLPPSSLRALYLTPDGWTAGKETSIDLVLRLAGLENAAGGLRGHRHVSLEWVLGIDPDLIVVGEGYEAHSGFWERLRTDPRYAPLGAVQSDRIVAVPARDVYTISHFLPAAAAELRNRMRKKGLLHG